MVHQHGDGLETDAQLMTYEIPDETEDYFPLQINAKWQYRVTDNRSAYAVRDTCWVATQEGETYHIAQYHSSEKV